MRIKDLMEETRDSFMMLLPVMWCGLGAILVGCSGSPGNSPPTIVSTRGAVCSASVTTQITSSGTLTFPMVSGASGAIAYTVTSPQPQTQATLSTDVCPSDVPKPAG